MSTKIGDLATAVAVTSALDPAIQTGSANGSLIDLIAADGDCFAIQQIGSMSGGLTWTGSIEESSNGSSWSAIAGATFTPVTASNNTQVIRFTRTARFVRYVGTVTGGSPSVAISAAIGEQKKSY
jgi:hypothetical protein